MTLKDFLELTLGVKSANVHAYTHVHARRCICVSACVIQYICVCLSVYIRVCVCVVFLCDVYLNKKVPMDLLV